MSGSISREVLKWLQSLDLSYSVKNPKRDFANGFLVAEILSRYYAQDVQMHSFDNGTGLQRKLDNWALLEKFFVRRGIPITRQMIDRTLHCKENAAVPLVEVLFTFLTNRTINTIRPPPQPEAPPFARPTASSIVRESFKNSELHTIMSDTKTNQIKAKELVEQHKNSLRQEKTVDPERFQHSLSLKPQARGERGPVQAVPAQASIDFKNVRVRTMDAKSLQARREVGSTNGSSRDDTEAAQDDVRGNRWRETGPSASDAARVAGGARLTSVRHDPNSEHTALRHLDEAVRLALASVSEDAHPVFQSDDAPRQQSHADRFVERLPSMSESESFAVLASIRQAIEPIAEAALISPREYVRVLALLARGVVRASTDAVASGMADIVVHFGRTALQVDSQAASDVFREYGIPLFAASLRSGTLQVEKLATFIDKFCALETGARIKAIQRLHDELKAHQDEFLEALAELAHIQELADDELVDLYLYYASIARKRPQPSVRVAGYRMLHAVAKLRSDLVTPILAMAVKGATDPWWSCRVEAAAAMVSLDCSDSVKACAELVRAEKSPLALKHFARSFLEQGTELGRWMVLQTLNYAPRNVRVELLPVQQNGAGGAVLPGFGATTLMNGSTLPLTAMPLWDGPALLRTLITHILEENLENLSPAHVDILRASLLHCEISPTLADAVLGGLEDHLLVALCDDLVCTGAAEVLMQLVRATERPGADLLPALPSTLRMAFVSGSDLVRSVTVDFLRHLANSTTALRDVALGAVSHIPPENRDAELITLISDSQNAKDLAHE